MINASTVLFFTTCGSARRLSLSEALKTQKRNFGNPKCLSESLRLIVMFSSGNVVAISSLSLCNMSKSVFFLSLDFRAKLHSSSDLRRFYVQLFELTGSVFRLVSGCCSNSKGPVSMFGIEKYCLWGLTFFRVRVASFEFSGRLLNKMNCKLKTHLAILKSLLFLVLVTQTHDASSLSSMTHHQHYTN